MSQQRKILIATFAAVFFVLAVIIFKPQEGTAPVTSLTPSKNIEKSTGNDLPKPTGKVDDTVSAVIEAAEEEDTQLSVDESDATGAVDVTEEANDFGATYDESEF